jgi:hypothetical protein
MNFSGPLAESILLILFAAALACFAGVSYVLDYHWRTYGFDAGKIRTMRTIYYLGGCFLLLAMGLSYLVYAP